MEEQDRKELRELANGLYDPGVGLMQSAARRAACKHPRIERGVCLDGAHETCPDCGFAVFWGE